ncbi:hypothetical protein NPIL_667131, partial [Nephila pilipes]
MEIYVHNISQDGANLWSWKVPYQQENQRVRDEAVEYCKSAHMWKLSDVSGREMHRFHMWLTIMGTRSKPARFSGKINPIP